MTMLLPNPVSEPSRRTAMTEYQSILDAKRALADYIRYYNFERGHSASATSHLTFEAQLSSEK